MTPNTEEKRKIRVLVHGNLCNLGYNFVEAINSRNDVEIEANLLISEQNLKVLDPSNPISENREIANGLPKYIIKYDEKKIRNEQGIWSLSSIIHNYKKIRKIYSEYDLIISSTLMNIWAFLCAPNYIALCTGADITELPYKKNLLSQIYILALKKAKMVGLLNINQLRDAERLRLSRYKIIPFALNTEKYNGVTSKPGEQIVILHSSRIDWTEFKERPNTVKKNDIFFRGFAQFYHNSKSEITKRIKILVVDCGEKKEVDALKQLINELKINEVVTFINKRDKQGLIELYQNADIVVDQFAVGAFGLNALEAMASGCVLMSYINKNNIMEYYNEMPQILNCKNEEEVNRNLLLLAESNFKSLATMKQLSMEWIYNNHSYEYVASELKSCIVKAVN